jgi:uncharacterized protein (TIGR02118 family)
MIKLIGLMKRKEGMTQAEFVKYWYEKHAAYAQRIVPPDALGSGYVQNYSLKFKEGVDAPYDAVGEILFDDMAHLQRWIKWYNSDAGKLLRDDEANFMDRAKRVVIITEERVMRTPKNSK